MIKLENVSKVYKNKRVALNDISFEIVPGEFVYVVGHSGAGKSTFLRLLYRQEKATSGKVLVEGKNIAKIRYGRVPNYRRSVGFVFQDYQLLSHRTTFENVAYALEVRGVGKKEIRERVNETLELVGLLDKAKQYPAQLSGGEQQRVAIARSIVNRPNILIADEPTGNLDPVTSRSIMNVLDAVNELETTVVVATHDQYMVNNHPKRTITFKNGIIFNDAAEGGYVVGDDDFDIADETKVTGTTSIFSEMEDASIAQEKAIDVLGNEEVWNQELENTLYETFSHEHKNMLDDKSEEVVLSRVKRNQRKEDEV